MLGTEKTKMLRNIALTISINLVLLLTIVVFDPIGLVSRIILGIETVLRILQGIWLIYVFIKD